MRSSKHIGLLGLILGCTISTSSPADDETWMATPGQIARLEHNLVMPSGAHPLTDYARYYWGTTVKSVRIIRGALVLGQVIGVHIMKGPVLQSATDQGCSWIYVAFDPRQKTPTAMCDGVG